MTQSYIDKPLYTTDNRKYCLIRHDRNGYGKEVWEAYVQATYISEWFVNHRGSLIGLVAEINHRCGGKRFPLGQPDFILDPTLPSYTNLPGDVVKLRVSWPSDREMAL